MQLMWDSLVEALKLLFSMNGYVMSVLAMSLRTSGIALLLGAIIGIPLGAWLGLSRFPGRNVLASVVNTGLALPPVVVGLFVYMLLSRRGPLGSLELLFTVPAMIIAQTIIAAPVIGAISMAAIGSVPRDMRTQALGLGASRWQTTWMVVREARVSLMAAVVTGFGAVISEVGAVMMVGGNIATTSSNETRVMTTAIVQETRMGNFERAMAFGLILVLVAFVIMLVATRLQQGARGRWLQS
jgi:tungstate transport system permease protein